MPVYTPPPRSPHASIGDGGDLGKFRLRVWQVTAAAVTVLITGWFCTFGAIPAILSLMVAKHVLVAILVMGIDVAGR